MIIELSQVDTRVARFMRDYLDGAGGDHSADHLHELIAVFCEMTTAGANGAVNAWIYFVIGVEFICVGCLRNQKRRRTKLMKCLM